MAGADEREDEEGLLKSGEVLDGAYRIEKELGRGGIGVVYKALDLEHQIPVAIKLLLDKWARDRKMVARFLREGRLAIRARHPNIVQIHAIKRRGGNGAPYIVMEFIEGTVLLAHVNGRKGLKLGLSFLPLARQLASLLAACHAQKIVHRDLKPANIMIVVDEDAVGGKRVKLLDFGIAKMFLDEEDGTQTSVGDQQPGTPVYMAPEQFMTLDKDADPAKMDVYSLGVILYEALVGRFPLYSPNRIGQEALAAHHEPEPLMNLDPSLPANLAQLVHEMLAKDPKKRPTMEQVRQRLKSRAEVVSVRSTLEVTALVAASPLSEGSLEPTADEPVPLAQPSATPVLGGEAPRSVGERSTKPQSASTESAVLSTGRPSGQQVTGPQARETAHRGALAGPRRRRARCSYRAGSGRNAELDTSRASLRAPSAALARGVSHTIAAAAVAVAAAQSGRCGACP